MQRPKQRQSSQQVQPGKISRLLLKPTPRLCCQHRKDEDESFAEAPAESQHAIIHKLVSFMNDSVVQRQMFRFLCFLRQWRMQTTEMCPLENQLLLYDSKDNSVLWKACQDSSPRISYIYKLDKKASNLDKLRWRRPTKKRII